MEPGEARRQGALAEEELAVLALLAEGNTVDRVARELGVSDRTVRRRMRSAARALGASSTIETVVLAVRRRMI
ncbi:LuxR C-terminal-related transcriptional regulator [Nocardioides insulae]|uniref:LuxR C-terminal-related transcriptional regulator n=1 Tax=Nocardioides insulae TaxID=394734 RepID=UPI0003FFE5D5|nr:LuxR C-terminal-related transcriptional regulator [Nocardioides insulae]